ncbi:Hok/Gef family protein [Enterobacter sp. JMULE2]|uniref:type I toxin-antitoxin system Hok family toxin n=1 Tax=Enterobacter sp. JMULE2 TaxID=2518340 RepID=UPI0015760351|nr:Hok/Gef family protein [Enterobacter sp. JMULE2]
MKQPQLTVLLCLLIVCLTLLVFTWLTRASLCEVRLKDGGREFVAVMDYECDKKSFNILF